MAMIGSLRGLFGPASEPKKAWGSEFVGLQTRDTPPDSSLAGLFSRLQPTRSAAWTPPSIRTALGVPSIFRAVSLISSTVGALSLDAFRQGVKLLPEDRPRLIVRPDPFRTPRDFFRDTAWNIASRGEAIWWIAARDTDDSAMSVLNIPPHEVSISWNLADLRYPIITWRGQRMANEDIIHLTFALEPGELRGVGPLQLCGAAVSVAVEAQEFAANFYGGGGYPSITIKSANELGGELDQNGLSEADRLRAQWVSQTNNTPRVIDPNIESIDIHDANHQGAATLQTRDYQNGDAARMFGIPGALMEYSQPGSSLTYQNIGQVLDLFTRVCLWPSYLEPIEQAMSDLLTRSTIARFNTDALLRADPKTRAEIYDILVPLGVQTIEQAQTAEGLLAGDVERAPVPFSPPQAIPDKLPIQTNTAATGIIGVRDEMPRPGPEPIVTRVQVLSMRARLQSQGRSSGYASIAHELNVSESTVRRRIMRAA